MDGLGRVAVEVQAAIRIEAVAKTAHSRLVRPGVAMKDAVRRGHLASSPVLDPPARDDSVERQAWTQDETRTFLDVASGDRLEAVWRLTLATGARRGELLGLQWPDVDDAAATIARQVLLGSGYNRMHVRETTKTRRVRRVRFDETTAARSGRGGLPRSRSDGGSRRPGRRTADSALRPTGS